MIRNILAVCLAIVIGILAIVIPADIEYPYLAAVIDSRSIDIGHIGINEIKGEVSQGFPHKEYSLESNICVRDYSMQFYNFFEFHAKLNGDKWSVYAAPGLTEEFSKEEASKTLALALDALIKRCRTVYDNKRSWQHE